MYPDTPPPAAILYPPSCPTPFAPHLFPGKWRIPWASMRFHLSFECQSFLVARRRQLGERTAIDRFHLKVAKCCQGKILGKLGMLPWD